MLKSLPIRSWQMRTSRQQIHVPAPPKCAGREHQVRHPESQLILGCMTATYRKAAEDILSDGETHVRHSPAAYGTDGLAGSRGPDPGLDKLLVSARREAADLYVPHCRYAALLQSL